MNRRVKIKGLESIKRDELTLFEIGLQVRCTNTSKFHINGNLVEIDCSTCDFSCGFKD